VWSGEVGRLQEQSGAHARNITEAVVTIADAFGRLRNLARLDPGQITPEIASDLNRMMQDVLSLKGLEPMLDVLDKSMHDFLADKGMLRGWSELIVLGADAASAPDLFRVFQQRFEYLLAVELSGIAVVVDAYHGRYGDAGGLAAEFWQRWTHKITLQIETYLAAVEKAVAARIDTATGAGSTRSSARRIRAARSNTPERCCSTRPTASRGPCRTA
jgi:hypothetical protein